MSPTPPIRSSSNIPSSNRPSIFIDGEAGTTGLQIAERLQKLETVELRSIDPAKRKDVAARRTIMAQVDLTVLCLPDDAARQSAALAHELGQDAPKIVDASTAHRVDDNWVYGFAELSKSQAAQIQDAKLVSNPGCYPTGAIALIHPLVEAGFIPPDHPVTVNAVSGYSGGGRQMIEAYEAANAEIGEDETAHNTRAATADGFKLYGLGLAHKHVPELQKYAGLTRKPLFVPSVGNFAQGMLVSVPLHLDQLTGTPGPEDLVAALQAHYDGAQLVKVIPTGCTSASANAEAGAALSAEDLNNSDRLELRVYCDDAKSQALLVARLDNLGKGAAGAAVQNIKLMLGLE